jgi:hypothetical protein
MNDVIFIENRPHNKTAYNRYDKKAKIIVVKIMAALRYVPHGNINDENYKKYDLNFRHEISDRFIAIENEVREKFDKIRDTYETIHIPIRKSNTQMDRYFVWNRKFDQVIIIDRITFLKYKHTLTKELCNSELDDGQKVQYFEKFIDVPKNECKYYRLIGDRLNDNFEDSSISGFLNYK